MPRAFLAVVAAIAAGPLLVGCGHGNDLSAVPTQTGSPPALWNPCDGLQTARVGRLFDATMTVDTGTADSPLCRFTPQEKGAPVVDANYALFPAGLAAAMTTFPRPTKDARISTAHVPGADDARLVVSRSKGTLLVTGFVQNGDLIQVVNAVDPPRHARSALVTAVRGLMADLSKHAAESGITDSSSAPTSGTPTPARP